jgi:hypothetical protein
MAVTMDLGTHIWIVEQMADLCEKARIVKDLPKGMPGQAMLASLGMN